MNYIKAINLKQIFTVVQGSTDTNQENTESDIDYIKAINLKQILKVLL